MADQRRDRSDPNWNPKVLGVGIATPERGQIQVTSTGGSMFPRMVGEAMSVKATVSLGFIVAIAWGAFRLGNERAIESEKIMDKVAELQAALKDQERTLSAQREECKNEVRAISNIESKITGIQAELIVLNSKGRSR